MKAIRAIAWLDERLQSGDARDVVVPVDVTDENGQLVVQAKITIYISAKKPPVVS